MADKNDDLFVAQQDYEAKSGDEINLHKGDVVEILDTIDTSAPKKPKLDPELDEVDTGNGTLDSSAAKHKLSVRPKRKYRDTRQTNININTRWKVRIITSESNKAGVSSEGWVPTLLLRPSDEPGTGGGPPPPDTSYRRDAVIRELIDTEEEFCQDLRGVLERYYFPLASDAKLGNARPPKCVRDNHELIFGNLKLITEFHTGVLMEGVKYYASEPVMLGRVFLRLERDFDKHVSYCRDEPLAQHFLQNNLEAKDYFMDVSHRLGDDKTLPEHLKLPIQRINDYQLLLKELVKYTCWLQEDASHLQRALELMLSVPHRASDDKFTSSIEGFRGSIHKLGRLLAHDWYSITKTTEVKKERYLFLFKARILVTKVKRISDDRSVFVLKDIIKLPNVVVRDFPEDPRTFELHQNSQPGYPLTLTAHRDLVKLYWLDEIRQHASDIVALEEHAADDLQVLQEQAVTQAEALTTTTTSYKTAEDRTVSEILDTTLQETVRNEAKTVIVEAKRAIVIPVEEPIQALVKPVEVKSASTTESVSVKSAAETKVAATSITQETKTVSSTTTQQSKAVEISKSVQTATVATSETKTVSSTATQQSKAVEVSKSIETKATETKTATATQQAASNPVEVKANNPAPKPTENPAPAPKPADNPAPAAKSTPAPHVETKVSNPSPTSNPTPAPATNPAPNPVKQNNPTPNPVEVKVSNPVPTVSNPSNPGLESAEEMSRRVGSISSSATRSEYREESSSSYTSITTNGREVSATQQSSAVSASTEVHRDGALISSDTIGYSTQAAQLKQDGVVIASQQTSQAIGSNPTPAILPAGGKPTFSKKIESANVAPGETAEFSCSVAGGRTDNLTWLKGNKPLDGQSDRIDTLASENGDEFTLRIRKCMETDSGTYTALAFNADGKSTCTAQLLVDRSAAENQQDLESKAPVFTVQLKDTELLTDTYLRFMIKVRGDPKPTVTFFKDGKEIKSDSKSILINRDHSENGFYELIIEKVTYIDVGTYKCVATNSFGTAETEAELKVIDHKNIFGDLKDKGALEAGEIPKFMWQRNGVYFEPDERFKVLMGDDENSLALVFQHVKPEDAGLYTCVAQTSSGLVQCSAELTVQGAVNQLPKVPEAPKINIEQKTFECSVGGSAMLDIGITGFPRPLVTWTHEGKPIEAGGKYKFLYEDAENYTLVIKNIQSSEAGKYEVHAKNDLGTDVGEIILDVKAPPKFKSKIADTSCLVGSKHEIKMEVDGSPRPTLTIYHDGTEVKTDERVSIETDGSTYKLIFKESKLEDSGSYSVTASNEISQATEFWKTQVYSPPKITKTLGENKIIDLKSNAEFSIKVEADPIPDCIWYQNDKQIQEDTETIILTSDGKGTFGLKITGAVTTDSGRYKCVLKNKHGESEDSVRVDVKSAPVVREGIKSITVTEGDTDVTLVATVDGYPRPTGRWFLGDIDLSDRQYEFDSDVDGDGNYKLEIKEVTPDFHGTYHLKLTNEFGSTESSAPLTVQCKPQLLKSLSNTKVNEGDTLSLEIEVLACPEPTVTWKKKGEEVSADARIKITRSNQRRETYNLTVDLVKFEDGGEYEVTVENALGVVSSKSVVTVHKLLEVNGQHETEEIKTQTCDDEVMSYPIENNEVGEGKVTGKTHTIEVSRECEIEEPLTPEISKGNQSGVTIVELEDEEPLLETDEGEEAIPFIIETNLNDGEIYETQTLTYHVKVGGSPAPTAEWYFNGKKLINTKDKKIHRHDKEGFHLDLPKMKTDKHQGKYEIRLKNALGEIKKVAKLTVLSESELRKPKIIEGLTDTPVAKEAEGQLSAVMTGDPEPEVIWYHRDQELSRTENITFKADVKDIQDGLKECKFTLIVREALNVDTGPYTIKASNKHGEDESTARLNVQMAPEIYDVKDVSAVPWDTAELTLTIQANPDPIITWTRDDVQITDSDAYRFEKDGDTHKLVINSVSLADAGKYTINASNQFGEASATIDFKTITQNPAFLTKLVDQIIVGDYTTATLRVRCEGLPKPTLQWFFNDVPIENTERVYVETTVDAQVSSNLVIGEFSAIDDGKYRCVAKNLVGLAETAGSTTIAQIPPSFDKKLDKNLDTFEGKPLELKLTMYGSPKPKVVWYKDGEEIQPDDPRIQTSLTPDGDGFQLKLNIDKCTPDDSGAYKVIVNNNNGQIASMCAVVVNQEPCAPGFIKPLENVSAAAGDPIKIEGRIIGYPFPKVEWTRDGLPIRTSSGLTIIKQPNGIIGLETDKCRPDQAGVYDVVITNKLGETSAQAAMEVLPECTKPGFEAELFPIKVVEGFPAKLEIKITGHPEPLVTWFRDGAEIIPDKHIQISQKPDGSCAIIIDKCTPHDAGTYKVELLNENGECASKSTLTVVPMMNDQEPEERPYFSTNIRDVHTDEGLQLVIEAPFHGNPVPAVKWTHNGEPVEPDERTLITCDGARVGLEIQDALTSDAGIYACELTNPSGTETKECKVTVRKIYQPPVIEHKFKDVQQVPGHAAKFQCRISGVPSPTTTWYKDDKPLHETDKYHIKHDGDAHCLYVKNLELTDAGKYKVKSVNREGSDQHEAELEVGDELEIKQRKEPPTFLKKIGDTQLYKGMTAKFTACATGCPDPEVEWEKDGVKLYPSKRTRMEKDRSGLLRLLIEGLDTPDIGKYSCRIFNPHGEDRCEASLTFDSDDIGRKKPVGEQYTDFDKFKGTGMPIACSDAPLISKMTDRHLTLSWKPSLPTGPRFPVTYQVEMLDLPHGDWRTIRTGLRTCICGVPHLEPFKDYKFRVRVENKFGISDPSPFAVTYRQKLEPEPPSFHPYLPPGTNFHLEKSQYFPKDFDIERPLHGNMNQPPVFLMKDDERQYGVKNHNVNMFWFVYGYPKPKISYTFKDEPIVMGDRYNHSYTRNGQATLFITRMTDADVGPYEALAKNELGEARQRVRLEIAEPPRFSRRLDEKYVMLRKTIRLEARVTGIPYPDIKWYKDWQPLATSSRVKIHYIDPDICTITISDVINRDEGLYSISARNVAGTTSSSAMVYISTDEWDYNYYNYSPQMIPIKPKTAKGYEDVYDLGDELGRGTQGITYHAAERMTGRNYAAKVMHGKPHMKEFMHSELDIMNSLSHRKLIRLQDSFERDSFFMIVMELAGGGELVKDYLLKQSYYTESEIAGYIRQILYGLQYMHDKNIGHFGLTIGDLLLSHPGSDDLKICDFGLSRRIQMGRLAPLHYGFPEYVSPETARGEGVDVATDMWSLGIITYILLSGISPFRGRDDRETLNKIRDGSWSFETEDNYWLCISNEGKDFIKKLLNVSMFERMDAKTALSHPWLNRADKSPADEHRISTDRLHNYYNLYQEWIDNASCRSWYRRNKLVMADDHPSRMVYPPGEVYTPETRTPEKTLSRKPGSWETRIPERPGLDYEIGAFTSESHYQYGPDTYLLQLRDTDFPVRLREYMKVAASRRCGRTLSDSDYDWRTPAIHERRRFTDVMDEEIDDERKERISKYGSADTYTLRRLRHELGYRLGTYAEAEALIESKLEGSLPFFREKQHIVPIVQKQDAELICFAVGDPTPVVQWFKNDTIIGENARVKITTDEDGRSILKFSPALEFDVGLYKVVARNKIGQTFIRTRVVLGTTPDSPDSPAASQISDTAVLLTWRQPKHDGYSPVLCYSLQYKLCDDIEWIQCADNIDHEFYLIKDLQPLKNYIFRLAARNSVGWGEFGVPTAVIKTKEAGAEGIKLSRAMTHLQQLTDSGHPITEEQKVKLDYSVERSPIEWDTDTNVSDKFNFISEISRGRFSVVVKGVNRETDSVIVGKLLECKEDTVGKTEQEWEAWRDLRHERIASLLAGYRKPDGPVAALIQERLQGANVLTYLASRHEYSEQVVASIISQVIDGIQYLHWRGLCHLNIQPDNVVLSTVRSVQVKIIDFGTVQKVSKLGTNVGTIDSHPEYIAPEILADEPAFPQSDIWSVGVLTYILLSGTSPFQGKTAEETKQNILYARYRFENLYKELSQEAVRFIMLIFKRNPTKRPTAEECHENRWFMPTDFMIKKRERAIFLGNRLKAYNEAYHKQKAEEADATTVSSMTRGPLARSNSIQEELLTTP